jgi:hypothetical protein
MLQTIIEKERYQHAIQAIYFKDLTCGNAEVRDEASFRMMIDRCRKKEYKISVFI